MLPYAMVDENTGDRICPVCDKRLPESYDATGESVTTNYQTHYEQEHKAPSWNVALRPYGSQVSKLYTVEANSLEGALHYAFVKAGTDCQVQACYPVEDGPRWQPGDPITEVS